MLRKRPVTVSSKQGLMSDHPPIPSPTDNQYKRPSSSFFNSPKLFSNFSSKGLFDSEAAMSPTSILDNKPFSASGNPFWSDRNAKSPDINVNENRHPWKKIDSKGVGLGIVDALNDEDDDKNSSKPDRRMVLFGSQLKIQIPHLSSSAFSPVPSPASPVDFGIKTFKSQSGPFSCGRSPCSSLKTPTGSGNYGHELINATVFTGCLNTSEMELSEDYTCVITHGPNPRTTHIFDNCIVESCGYSAARKENGPSSSQCCYPSDEFLSSCYACKKKLGHGKDIYMYRGEKAFCSRECRYREMISDEVMGRGPSDSSVEHLDDVFA